VRLLDVGGLHSDCHDFEWGDRLEINMRERERKGRGGDVSCSWLAYLVPILITFTNKEKSGYNIYIKFIVIDSQKKSYSYICNI